MRWSLAYSRWTTRNNINSTDNSWPRKLPPAMLLSFCTESIKALLSYLLQWPMYYQGIALGSLKLESSLESHICQLIRLFSNIRCTFQSKIGIGRKYVVELYSSQTELFPAVEEHTKSLELPVLCSIMRKKLEGAVSLKSSMITVQTPQDRTKWGLRRRIRQCTITDEEKEAYEVAGKPFLHDQRHWN